MFTNLFTHAKAQIKGGKIYPHINGTVTFKETKAGVLVTAKIHGLPEGTSCRGNINDEFANAKSHLNTTNCSHPFHIGDLPPLIENNGYAYMRVLIDKFKIKDIIGKVVIIHDMPDDFTSQPSRKFRN